MQPPDMVIGVLQEARIDLHLARQHRLEFRGHVVPRRDLLGPSRQLGVLRNDAQLFLPREDLLAQLVPALIELAFVLVSPLFGHVVWRMGGARREVHEERLVGHQRLLLAHPGDRLVGQVFGEVVALLGVFGGSIGVVPS